MKFFQKKFLTQRKNIILFSILILVILSLFVWNKTSASNFFYNNQILTLNQNIQSDEQNLASIPKSQQAESKKEINQLVKEKSAWQKKDFNTFYKLANQDNLTILSEEKADPQSFHGNIKQVKNSIAYYNAVKKTGQSFSMLQGSDNSAWSSFLYMSSWESSIIILVLFSLICGDFFNNEFPNGLRFFNLWRISKQKLVINYLVTPVWITFSVMFGLFLLLFIGTGLVSGFGSPSYPYIFLNDTLLSVGKISFWSIVYLLLSLIFITALGQFLAVLIKKPYLSSAVLVLIFVIYSVLQGQNFMKPFLPWIPLSYLGSGQILSFGGNLVLGTGYIFACSALLFGLTQLLFSRYIFRKE